MAGIKTKIVLSSCFLVGAILASETTLFECPGDNLIKIFKFVFFYNVYKITSHQNLTRFSKLKLLVPVKLD